MMPLVVPWSRHRGLAERHAGTLAAPRPCLGVAALRQSAGAGRAKQLYGSAGGWPIRRAPCAALPWPCSLMSACASNF